MKNERTKQKEYAERVGKGLWYSYQLQDGAVCDVYAASESHAFRVVNAEHPHMLAALIAPE
jgi:hypothetical protein